MIDRLWHETDTDFFAEALLGNKAGLLEDLDVFGDTGERHRIGPSEGTDREGPARDPAQDISARFVGERMEDEIQIGITFNHIVE